MEERIERFCCIGSLGVDRCIGNVEFQRAATLSNADVIDAEPGPTGCDDDGVCALVHHESAHFRFFPDSVACLEGIVGPIDRHIDHFSTIKRVVTHMDDVFPTLHGIIDKSYPGVFIDQFKCLPAGILAVPDERAVGVVRILGFQLGAVLRER